MGYLPRFAGEAALYGRYVARTRPKARIAVLHEDSEYGQDMFVGFVAASESSRRASAPSRPTTSPIPTSTRRSLA